MALKFETKKDSSGKNFTFFRKGKAAGRKELIKNGWEEENNPNFLSKGKRYAHFNSILKVWLIE